LENFNSQKINFKGKNLIRFVELIFQTKEETYILIALIVKQALNSCLLINYEKENVIKSPILTNGIFGSI